MTPLESLILGVVQGLTEFLPVSSSGHLVLVQSLMRLEETQLFFFDVMLHVSTLLAVVVFMRGEIWGICIELTRLIRLTRLTRPDKNIKIVGDIIIASIPTAIIAFSIKDPVESLFTNPRIVGFMLIITGLILWTFPKLGRKRKISKIGSQEAILIGIAQGIAVTPGISRSGTTISTAMALGVQPDIAAKFSFLLSIPAVAGAGILELLELRSIGKMNIELLPLTTGMISAFLIGYASLKFLFSTIRQGKFSAFAYYCWFIGIVMLVLGAIGGL